MAEHLDGLVTVRHLAVTDPPVLDGGRMRTPAGEVAQVLNGPEVRFVALVEFAFEGATRGDHVHIGRTEIMYVIEGRLEGTYVDVETGAQEVIELGGGDLVTTVAGCAHAYRALTVPCRVLEMSERPYHPDATQHHQVTRQT